MNDVLVEMARQIPSAVAVIGMAYLFLKAEKEREERRVVNAKEMEKERRDHELMINNMWATYIKTLVDKQNETYLAIAGALESHEEASKDRYERMGITKELLQAVKQTIITPEEKKP